MITSPTLESLFNEYKQKLKRKSYPAELRKDDPLTSQEISDLIEDKYTLKLDLAERNPQKISLIEEYLQKAGKMYVDYEKNYLKSIILTSGFAVGLYTLGYVGAVAIAVGYKDVNLAEEILGVVIFGTLSLSATCLCGRTYFYQRSQEKLIKKYRKLF
jgi:hypothetical protein